MSNIAKLKKKAAELEQKKQFDKALAVYVQILENLDPREDEADVGLYNRVGDLLIRQGNVPEALNYYEKAVDLYADGGFFNNAIALCNKILRNAPGRSSIYYKLGKISAKKGFVSDAKQNFLEYADRMQKVGQIDEAFRALKEFADLCPDQDDIRLMLAEQLSKRDRKGEALEQLQVLYERLESEGRTAEARATIDRMKAIDPAVEPKSTGPARKEKSSELVFLDVNYDDAPATRPTTRRDPAPPSSADQAREPRRGPTADLPLIEPEPFADLQAEPELSSPDVSHGAQFDAPMESGGDQPSVVDEPLAGFQGGSASFDADLSGGFGGTIDLEHFGIQNGDQPDALDGGGLGALDRLDTFERPEHDLMLPGELPALDSPDTRFSTAQDIEFMNDPFGSTSEPSALGELAPSMEHEEERPSLGLDDEVPLILLDDGAESLAGTVPLSGQAVDTPFYGGDDAFAIGAATPEADPDDPLEQLRQRVLADDSNPSLRRELAEALVERGDREGGLAELETAMIGFERGGDLDAAESVADEIIRLNPNSVRHHQKRVEYAFRTNDKPRLGEAYLELADALFRTGQQDKARSVYQRVLELAPDDVRAQAALSAFVDPSAPAAAANKPAKPQKEQSGVFRRYTAEPQKAEPPPAPSRPTPMADGDSLVNLGDWLRSEEGPRSTRMVVDERAPSGDEQADFGEMLRKFKQGVAQNIEEEDHESHYDLGVAYKEMGLLDEAIAEFQKALRGAHHRVRTYEALGQCFLEQSQFPVAATVLGRALSEAGYGDEQLVGVLYLLGYASEALQQWDVALNCYQRVYAVDIGFRDVASRIAALQRVTT